MSAPNASPTESTPPLPPVPTERTTLLRDFTTKINHVIVISEALDGPVQSKDSTDNVKNDLMNVSDGQAIGRIERISGVLQSIKKSTNLVKNDLHTVLVNYANDVMDGLNTIVSGFKVFVSKNNVSSIRSKIEKIRKIQLQLRDVIKQFNNDLAGGGGGSSSFGPMSRYRQQDGTISANVRARLNDHLNNISDMLQTLEGLDMKEVNSIDLQKIRTTINNNGNVSEVLNRFNEVNIPGTVGKLIDGRVLELETDAKKYERIYGVTTDRDKGILTLGKYKAFLSSNAGEKIYTPSPAEESLVGSGIFDKLTLSYFIGIAKSGVDSAINSLHKELRDITKKTNDIIDKWGKVSDGETVSKLEKVKLYQESLKSVIESLDKIQFIGLSSEYKDILKQLREFIEQTKGKETVLDKIQTITVSNDGSVVNKSSDSPDNILSSFEKNSVRKIGVIKTRDSPLFNKFDDALAGIFIDHLNGFLSSLKSGNMRESLETIKNRLYERTSNIDRLNNDNKLVQMQTNSKLKFNAYGAYVGQVKHLFREFVSMNTNFVMNQHRNALEYMQYWSDKFQQNEKLGTSEAVKLVTSYFKTRNELIEKVNSLIDETINEVIYVKNNINKEGGQANVVKFKLNDDQVGSLASRMDSLIGWVQKRGGWINDIYVKGGMHWFDLIMSNVFLIMYFIKVLRIVFCWFALRWAESYYIRQLGKSSAEFAKPPPDPIVFLIAFLILDLGFSLILIVMSKMLKTLHGKGPKLVLGVATDVIISILIMLLLSFIIASVVKNKKYFRFRYDPKDGIRTIKTIIYNVYIPIVLLPYFRIAMD